MDYSIGDHLCRFPIEIIQTLYEFSGNWVLGMHGFVHKPKWFKNVDVEECFFESDEVVRQVITNRYNSQDDIPDELYALFIGRPALCLNVSNDLKLPRFLFMSKEALYYFVRMRMTAEEFCFRIQETEKHIGQLPISESTVDLLVMTHPTISISWILKHMKITLCFLSSAQQIAFLCNSSSEEVDFRIREEITNCDGSCLIQYHKHFPQDSLKSIVKTCSNQTIDYILSYYNVSNNMCVELFLAILKFPEDTFDLWMPIAALSGLIYCDFDDVISDYQKNNILTLRKFRDTLGFYTFEK